MATLVRPAEFGWHTYAGHSGAQDYFWGSNRNIYAAHEGRVELIVNSWTGSSYPGGDRAYGNYLMIRHPNGVSVSVYAHIARNSFSVSVGDYVSAGQYLAQMNNTGYSNGTHLHFEFRPYGAKLGSADEVEHYFYNDLPGTGAGAPVGGVAVEDIWDGVSTNFKGNYDKQANGLVITVQVGGGPEGWPANRGNLNDINIWTQALANSKYAWDYLQEGGSYMTQEQLLGGANFYAGNVYAIGDVVAMREAEEKEALEKAKAEAEQKVKEAEAEALRKTESVILTWSGGGEDPIVAEGVEIDSHSEEGLPPLPKTSDSVETPEVEVPDYSSEKINELEKIADAHRKLVQKIEKENSEAYKKAIADAREFIIQKGEELSALGKAAEGESQVAGFLKNNPVARSVIADVLWISGLGSFVLAGIVSADLLTGEPLLVVKDIVAWTSVIVGGFATYAGFVWKTNITKGSKL